MCRALECTKRGDLVRVRVNCVVANASRRWRFCIRGNIVVIVCGEIVLEFQGI